MLYLLSLLEIPQTLLKIPQNTRSYGCNEVPVVSQHRRTCQRPGLSSLDEVLKKIAMQPLQDHTPSRFSSVGVDAFPALELLLLERLSLLASRRGALRALTGD